MKLIILSNLLLTQFIYWVRADGACDTWDSYKDEKCFIVLPNVVNFQTAKGICQQQKGTLVQITTAEEQNFLNKLLFETHKVVDDVWIGAVRAGKTFKWDLDKNDVAYTNWADKNPSNVTGEDCVQMLPKLNNQEGKWDDENCGKANRVICQKYQVWTPVIIQQNMLKERKQLEEITNRLNSHDLAIDKTIPIGFTYVQLPKEKAPAEIWPNYKWKDNSAKYAGFFFRVEGAPSAAFGAIQEDDCPRLNKISMSDVKGYVDAGVPIAKGGVGKIKTGVTGGPWYFQFLVSNTEVRPRNMAMRVWNRVG